LRTPYADRRLDAASRLHNKSRMAVHDTMKSAGVLGRELTISARTIWTIFWAAAGSFLPLLFLQQVGEEPIWPIMAREMWATQDFVVTTLYGLSYGRPGLYAWLILLPTAILGEQHTLIAARLIAASSTLLIGLTLAWLVRRLFKDRLFAAFAAAVFLSGDTLLQRGWIAYADPTFSLLTFAAMACLWVATEERRRGLLILAALCLIGSFLAKVLTGYLFYAVLGLVLLWRHKNRGFLFTPWSMAVHATALAFPVIWNYAVAGDTVFLPALMKITDLARNEDAPSIATYLKLFAAYPFRVLWYLMPVSAIALYAVAARKIPPAALRENAVVIAAATVAINLLPYWFVPGSSARYLMPLYPLCALVLAYVVMHSGKFILDLSAKALIATVGVAYLMALAGYPLYEHYFRGNYDQAAAAIYARAGGVRVYVKDDTSVGLCIAESLDAQRGARPLVAAPPAGFASGFVLAAAPDAGIGPVDMTVTLGRDAGGRRTRYLLCRGEACSAPGRPAGPLTF
jgi:4-amino-4-deoxy-L-arabinose transferase-like glycosyltransferase